MRDCTINGIRIGRSSPVRLMGVINCSPESFYPGSYVPPEQVRERALAMADAGADLVDVGGRATGPGSPPIPVAVERERVVAALSALEGSGVTVAVDTMHPEVLSACLRFEIHAVNDISGLSNPACAGLVSDSGLPAIAMASRAVPGDAAGVQATLEALELVVGRCREHGIDEFILDPGIGRWVPSRASRDDWDLVRNFGRFHAFGRPLLAAVSRKTFIGDLLGRGPEGRLPGSLAVALLLALEGASLVRSHDVRETRDALAVLAEVKGGPR